MTDYTAFVTKWNTLSGTTAAKLTQINAATQAQAQPAIISANKIVNAIVATDLVNLTTNQLLAMTLALAGGGSVDASPSTTVRAVFSSIFAGKTQTLANLTALVAPFDNATVPWWQANGYPRAFDMGDVAAAGVS